MCLIILSKKGDAIPRNAMRIAFKNNGDGIGFSYSKEGRLIVQKGFTSFNSFYKEYRKTPHYPHVVHFRKSSQGNNSQDNCHPFLINENLSIVHNGCIFNTALYDKEKSDTRMLVEKILKPIFQINPNFLKSDYFPQLFRAAVKTGKFVFFDNNGDYLITGEELGHWTNDIWWSNYSYIADDNDWKFDSCDKFKIPKSDFLTRQEMGLSGIDEDEYFHNFMMQ